MNLRIDQKIRDRPELEQAVRAASDQLAELVGPAAVRITADWLLTRDDRGRELLNLNISDWTGSVGYRFASDELGSSSHMLIRLNRLWSDLLMVRSHVQLDEMKWGLLHMEVE